ncbi:MAG: sugar phosphate isomerase/epimerase family protein [Pirellulales bacterium]
MIPTISQVCSLNSPFEQDIEDYAAGQCRSVEVWMTKLENYLAESPVESVRQLLSDCDVWLPVASYQGGLLASQGAARQEAWDLLARRLDLCAEVGIGTLVVACDVVGPLTQDLLDRTQVSLTQLAQRGGESGVRIALEFQGRSSWGNNLQTAVALVEDTGSPHLGLCLDSFHFGVGPSKPSDLRYLTRENLFHVQLSDVADTARELCSDADRILPGEGDLEIDLLIDRLRDIGYQGCVSLELMNPQIWQVSARQFGEIGMTALRKVLGQAQP